MSGSRALHGRRSRSRRVPKARWNAHLRRTARAPSTRWSSCCRGASRKGVMERLCQQKTGLFPAPAEIEFDVQLPRLGLDVQARRGGALRHRRAARRAARAAVRAAQGRREGPDRQGRPGAPALERTAPPPSKLLGTDGLSELFGLDLGSPEPGSPRRSPQAAQEGPAQTDQEANPEALLPSAAVAAPTSGACPGGDWTLHVTMVMYGHEARTVTVDFAGTGFGSGRMRRRLGLAPGSFLEWDAEGDVVVVRRGHRYSSADVHSTLFPKELPTNAAWKR